MSILIRISDGQAGIVGPVFKSEWLAFREWARTELKASLGDVRTDKYLSATQSSITLRLSAMTAGIVSSTCNQLRAAGHPQLPAAVENSL